MATFDMVSKKLQGRYTTLKVFKHSHQAPNSVVDDFAKEEGLLPELETLLEQWLGKTVMAMWTRRYEEKLRDGTKVQKEVGNPQKEVSVNGGRYTVQVINGAGVEKKFESQPWLRENSWKMDLNP